MKTKILEIRDRATFIAVIAMDMNTDNDIHHWYLRRYGYPCDGRPNILLSRVDGDGKPSSNDPYFWKDRTMAYAHDYIIRNWDKLSDGDVIDVEFILSETPTKKISERIQSSLYD